MSRVAKNRVTVDGKDFQITDTNSVSNFLKLFREANFNPSGGNVQYINNHGFTNTETPARMTPQGIGKIIAQLLESAALKIAKGDAEAEEMKTVLSAVLQYAEVAEQNVAEYLKNQKIKAAQAAIAAAGGIDSVLNDFNQSISDRTETTEVVETAVVTDETVTDTIESVA